MLRGGNLRGPICLVLLALFLVFAGAAAADEVFLKSGDRLRWTIEGIDPKEVTLQTTYAGRIRIRRQEVAAIQADLPLRVTFPSGTRLVGTIAPRYGDTLQLVTPDFRRAWEFRFADIQTATRQTATRTGPPPRRRFPRRFQKVGNSNCKDALISASMPTEAIRTKITITWMGK